MTRIKFPRKAQEIKEIQEKMEMITSIKKELQLEVIKVFVKIKHQQVKI